LPIVQAIAAAHGAAYGVFTRMGLAVIRRGHYHHVVSRRTFATIQ